jgi:hypothetical protein
MTDEDAPQRLVALRMASQQTHVIDQGLATFHADWQHALDDGRLLAIAPLGATPRTLNPEQIESAHSVGPGDDLYHKALDAQRRREREEIEALAHAAPPPAHVVDVHQPRGGAHA